MVETETTKIRKTRNSRGEIIPKQHITVSQWQVGQEGKIALLPRQKEMSGYGFARKFKVPFQRDKRVRDFR